LEEHSVMTTPVTRVNKYIARFKILVSLKGSHKDVVAINFWSS